MHPTERVHLLYILIVWTCFTVGCAFAASHGRVCLRRPPLGGSVSAVPPFVPPAAVAWGVRLARQGSFAHGSRALCVSLRFGRSSLSAASPPAALVLSAGALLALFPCPFPSCLRVRRTARSAFSSVPFAGLRSLPPLPVGVARGSLAYPPACLIRHRSQIFPAGFIPRGASTPV